MRTLIELVFVVAFTLGHCERYGEDPSKFAGDARVVGQALSFIGEVLQDSGDCLQSWTEPHEGNDKEV